MTVRTRIEELRAETQQPDLPLSRLQNVVLELSSLLGRVNSEVKDADVLYRRHLNYCRQKHKSVNAARIEADAGSEYERLAEAKAYRDSVEQSLISTRKVIESLTQEMRLQR